MIDKKYALKFLGKKVKVKMDRPLGVKHPKYDWVYECNYGYIPDTKAPDGEGVDAYVLRVNEPLSEYTGECIAVIQRIDDDDDKLIVVPFGIQLSDGEITEATYFQEKFFESVVVRE